MANPICFKCGADYMSFGTKIKVTPRGTLVILFCKKCGAVQGVVKE